MNIRPIVIVDFGSQYTQLIARTLRQAAIYCEICSPFLSETEFRQLHAVALILSGGPASVGAHVAPKLAPYFFAQNIPILGICYGMQAMADFFGGRVGTMASSEFGAACFEVLAAFTTDPLFVDIPAQSAVWMSHSDAVVALPSDFVVLGRTERTDIAAMRHVTQPWYGVQFHPEVLHTPYGAKMLENFACQVAQVSAQWTVGTILTELIQDIRQQVGGQKVMLAYSGGVDSTVLALLLHQAIGAQCVPVFVDTGLLREGEVHSVVAAMAHLGITVHVVDAQARFIEALAGVHCPEEKRKIIGHVFIAAFEAESQHFSDIPWLAQGTIYPDVIESGFASQGHAGSVIKSHHNVGGLPEKLGLSLLEPLRKLFKDEVRALGELLQIPSRLVYRHPFPGPGLAIRIMGAVTPEALAIVRKADAIFIRMLESENLYAQVSQAFVVFLPVKTVGVVGDERRYGYVLCIRIVESTDFMTARPVAVDFSFLERVSTTIINKMPEVARVTYDITSKPPATIEWE